MLPLDNVALLLALLASQRKTNEQSQTDGQAATVADVATTVAAVRVHRVLPYVWRQLLLLVARPARCNQQCQQQRYCCVFHVPPRARGQGGRHADSRTLLLLLFQLLLLLLLQRLRLLLALLPTLSEAQLMMNMLPACFCSLCCCCCSELLLYVCCRCCCCCCCVLSVAHLLLRLLLLLLCCAFVVVGRQVERGVE